MIIGHLPSGYIASKILSKSRMFDGYNEKLVVTVGTIGGIAPDFDMFYFYLVDNRQHHHHTYWSHYPSVWFVLIFFSILLHTTTNAKKFSKYCLLFSVCGFLHLLLDSIVGDIWWGAPIVDEPFALFTVPALVKPWWLNFLIHWSFLFEILIVISAAYLWFGKTEFERF